MQSLSSFRKPPISKSMGIELECVMSDTSSVSYDQYVGFFYTTRDGSIRYNWRNEIPLEFVSMPLTPKWLKKEIDKLGKKYQWTANHSCGIHIHVSQKWLSGKKAQAIAKFLEKEGDEMFELLFGRRPNYYCKNTFSLIDRYHAINFTNKDTIEFRMFKSGSPEWAKYCVDCVCYLIEHAYHLNVDACLAFRDLYKE